jgi:hypothetical protein
MRYRCFRAPAVLLSCAAAAATTHAEDWVEPRSNDAGRVPQTAALPDPSLLGQPMDSISGELEQFMQGRGVPPSPTDGQDMFLIFIDDPAGFTARAVTVGGSSLTDPQLYLFSAAGLGQLGNDNFQTADPYPRLSPVADDGTFTLTTAGLYYIAISGVGSNPYSGSAADLMFAFSTGTELSGPDGPGGSGVITDWTTPSMYGHYRIELTGVIFLPSPASGVLGALGAAAVMRRRRR